MLQRPQEQPHKNPHEPIRGYYLASASKNYCLLAQRRAL